jgi:hypothetical protein
MKAEASSSLLISILFIGTLLAEIMEPATYNDNAFEAALYGLIGPVT